VSGPLRDRIDLWVTMPRVPSAVLVETREPEDSVVVAVRIAAARRVAIARSSGILNGRLRGRSLRHACRLTGAATHRLIGLAEMEGASGRGTERLLRVARTIADLGGQEAVGPDHLEEAAWFRMPDARAVGALAS